MVRGKPKFRPDMRGSQALAGDSGIAGAGKVSWFLPVPTGLRDFPRDRPRSSGPLPILESSRMFRAGGRFIVIAIGGQCRGCHREDTAHRSP